MLALVAAVLYVVTDSEFASVGWWLWRRKCSLLLSVAL